MQMNTREDSDRQLREAVLRQLEWVPQLTSYNIGVEATDGVVTLTGLVHTCAEKYAAQRTAHGVSGVHAVANEIEVRPASARSDAELARDVMQAMKISVTAPEEIKVIVDGGGDARGNRGIGLAAKERRIPHPQCGRHTRCG